MAAKILKVVDDKHFLASKYGNGILRREVWVDEQGRVLRYNLAYINHHVFHGDNGRVIGYDNAHGFHHKHALGVVEEVDFVSFSDTEEKFELAWLEFRRKQ
jgi:hypothetical protein